MSQQFIKNNLSASPIDAVRDTHKRYPNKAPQTFSVRSPLYLKPLTGAKIRGEASERSAINRVCLMFRLLSLKLFVSKVLISTADSLFELLWICSIPMVFLKFESCPPLIRTIVASVFRAFRSYYTATSYQTIILYIRCAPIFQMALQLYPHLPKMLLFQ